MPCSYYTAVTSGLVHELYGVMQGNRLTWEAINRWGGGGSLIGSESVADISTPALQHAVIKVTKNLIKSQNNWIKPSGNVHSSCQYLDHSPAALLHLQ